MTKGEWMKEHELYVSNVNPCAIIREAVKYVCMLCDGLLPIVS